MCDFTVLKRKLPIFSWLPKYQLQFLLQDFIAGFTVGLTTIPQAIAYGTVAGLDPQYGLYSAFMGCFTYIVFGSCKDVTIATTAIMALMINPYATISPDYAVMVCFLAGCIIVLMGLFNLGVLVQFISIPVVTGFTMAAACTIASAQINNLFGLSSPSNEFIAAWKNLFTHLSSTRLYDAVLGWLTLCLLIAMSKIKDIRRGNRTFLKYISLSRNAVAVIIGTSLAYFLSRNGSQPFRITGDIIPGLPPFKLPPFSTNINGTYVPFAEMISTVGPSLASIPLVAILEIVAIAKAFSKGKVVDASQEMIALGMCNIMGSFVSSMPVTGSFTRTAVNNASGVKTPLGGAVTGTLVIMALALLTQTFRFIPKASLAAIIIAAMIQLVEFKKIPDIWKSRKLDLFPFLVTFFTCLFWSLEYGILCGVLANMTFILYSSARPKIEIVMQEVNGVSLGLVDIKQKVSYTAAEYLKTKILSFIFKQNGAVHLVIINGRDMFTIDYTVAMNILSLVDDLKSLNCKIICWNWNTEACQILLRLDGSLQKMFMFEESINEVVLLSEREANCGSNESYDNSIVEP